MRFTFFAIFLLLVGSNNANANSYQCAKLENGSSIAFELRKDSNFENCLSIGTDNLDGLSVIYESVGAEQSDLELFAITSASNYQLLNIFSSNNDNRISFVSQATTAYSQLGLRILPTNFELRDKIVRVSFFIEEKEAVVLIKMQNVPGTSSGETTPPPNPDEDLCRKNCGTAPLSLMQSCEYTDQGTVDSSFDTVAHAQYFSDMKTLIDSTYGEGSLRASLTTGAMMAMNFYTNMPYDLKNSSVYTADATFGNYFYGIAAQRMGYSKEEAVKAGAAVQTAQNFNNIGSYSLGDMVSDLSKLARGADPSTIDNADDTPIIEAGYDDGAKNENCESNDGSDEDSVETGVGGEDSSGSSVGGGFSGGFIGSGSCIGKCFIPNGSVDVTDLPPIDGV